MGAIQNSFNQLLGIAAAGAITTGKALTEQHAKSLEVKHEEDKLLKERDCFPVPWEEHGWQS